MSPRPAAFLLSLLLASTALAVDWPTDYGAALERAKSEKKVVLVHFRSSCGICNRTFDQSLKEAEKHPPITALYDSFVRVRVNDGAVVGAVEPLINQDPPAPSVLIVDPSGWIVVAFRKLHDPNQYLGALNTALAQAPLIVQIGALRSASHTAEADHLQGHVVLGFNQPAVARDLYERAHAAYDRAGNHELGELASIHADFARCLLSDMEKNRGISALMRATMFGKSKENVAEAWVAIARVRKMERDRGGAVKAFHKVLEVAANDSALARSARRELEELDDHPVEQQSAAATVTIVKPSRATITGRAQFAARVNASRVEFLLDDLRVANITKPPFETRIDLGSVPRLHTIKAIAYDAAGKPIGEAVTTVNDRADAPHVTLVSPVADIVSGSVRVEADAHVPADRTLKSVELFWNDARLARFDAPPFRVDFEAPSSFGYFRAVATLDDGTTAEDTRVVNGSGMSAEVDVHAISFLATVVDRDGKRLTGLKSSDFVVRDEGKRVNVTVRDSVDEPVTIGLVIDASGSMQTSLLNVMEMTSQFFDATVSPRDKVFVVAFESQPSLLHPPSGDVASLKKSVMSIRPSGTTAVVDGVAFGLQQFAGVIGRKALVVLTDGREGTSSQTSEAAIHLAKDSGIPVYGVVTGGANRLGNPLINIAEATGGAMFFAPRRTEVIPMFEQIRDEVRGQYLISFIADDGRPGEWRNLTVAVARRDARVRTVSGYFAR